MRASAPNYKSSKKTGEATPSKRQPKLPSRYETAPPDKTTGQRCTEHTKSLLERAACPPAPGRGAPILPANNKDRERCQHCHVYEIGDPRDHPTLEPKKLHARKRSCNRQTPKLHDIAPRRVTTWYVANAESDESD